MNDVETIEEFEARWGRECDEWIAIRDELRVSRKRTAEQTFTTLDLTGCNPIVKAHEVTVEQRRRMTERGEVSVLDGVFARRLINRRFRLKHGRRHPKEST